MNFLSKSKTTLALLSLCVTLSTVGYTSTTKSTEPKVWGGTKYILSASAIALVVSIWKHLSTFPEDRKNTYTTQEVKQALKEIPCGKNVKANLKVLFNFWKDGICGHPSKVGSPRFNDKTGLHEMPYIESRGLFGWISDQMDPFTKTFNSLPAAYAMYVLSKNQISTTAKAINEIGTATSADNFAALDKVAKPLGK